MKQKQPNLHAPFVVHSVVPHSGAIALLFVPAFRKYVPEKLPTRVVEGMTAAPGQPAGYRNGGDGGGPGGGIGGGGGGGGLGGGVGGGEKPPGGYGGDGGGDIASVQLVVVLADEIRPEALVAILPTRTVAPLG